MNVPVFASPGGQTLGRVYLFHCKGPLGGPAPETLVKDAAHSGARALIVDAMQSHYGDSDGLRWLLRLKSAAEERGMSLRIAARQSGNIWRNVMWLKAGFCLYPSVQSAWSAPGSPIGTGLRSEQEKGIGYVGT